jgi:hypothetical protein
LNLALRLLCLILIVTHIWRYGNHLPESRMIGNGVGKKTRNSCSLSVKKKKNESHHLLFWLLGTLIGLRIRVRGLIA